MKYLTILTIIAGLFGCKSTKIEKQTESHITWEKVDFKPNKEMILPNAYSTFTLQAENFTSQLKSGKIELPMPNGELSSHLVEDSQTMSEELQAKYPNIRSYKGYNEANSLCQSRIDQKDESFKIVIFCNDASIYIQDLNDLGLYFVYYKKDLPEGVGTVKE